MASDGSRKTHVAKELSPLSGVAALALQKVAIERVAVAGNGAETDLFPVFQSLLTSRIYAGPEQPMQVLAEANISPEGVLDSLIPTLASAIGEKWLSDEMSWSNVTIVSARLQTLAWRYIEDSAATAIEHENARSVLMVVPEGEEHSLGCVLAMGILLRHGLKVTGLFGESDERVFAQARSGAYDVIGVSTSGRGGKDRLEPFLSQLSHCSPEAIHVIGGSIKGCNQQLLREACGVFEDLDIEELIRTLQIQPAIGSKIATPAHYPDQSVT